MVIERGIENSVDPAGKSHRCGLLCLGPLTFHSRAVGKDVRLSHECRLAERTVGTFKNGLVFSNRPVKVQERMQLRVEKDRFNWTGALRVGFTTVPPSDRVLPLPCFSIPNLTRSPGHWAAPVHEAFCQAGSVLEFWVSHGGTMYIKSNNSKPHRLLRGVDLSQPLWAMIDIYGQTCSINLLGSKKKKLLFTRQSCPAPELLSSPNTSNPCSFIPDDSTTYEIPANDDCVVCMGNGAKVTLPCGHRCLCGPCYSRIFRQFGFCPLCRCEIKDP
uniref:E3 ubiquitin-protein ligase NEURL3 n=1 Tax=Monopterus albus TaxID=43700 RepID=A0A3Q3IHV5_MONAL|nr:E3 ubiquitin-protein ligase NEURL3 [Monopterus albus]